MGESLHWATRELRQDGTT